MLLPFSLGADCSHLGRIRCGRGGCGQGSGRRKLRVRSSCRICSECVAEQSSCCCEARRRTAKAHRQSADGLWLADRRHISQQAPASQRLWRILPAHLISVQGLSFAIRRLVSAQARACQRLSFAHRSHIAQTDACPGVAGGHRKELVHGQLEHVASQARPFCEIRRR